MPRPRPASSAATAALAALLALAALQPEPARAAEPLGQGSMPLIHGSIGTGACAAPTSATTRVDNPCWLQLGLAPAVQLGRLELGLTYEGRDLLKAITFLLVRPPAVTSLGASAGWVLEPSERWRLLAAGEAGWRRYMDFAGTGLKDRTGAADTVYLGVTGRAALGLRPQAGRTDRMEVSLSLRSDLKAARDTVDGVPWSARGWSFTMGLGLVSAW
jgi:hypothetical protein